MDQKAVIALGAMVGTLRPGMLLADTYRIVRLIGEGGMGEVYEATHDRLAGKYAVKVLLAEMVSRAEVFQRFRREAEVTSGLRHPNIVQIVDFNVTPEGHPYLVMEYLDGVELATEINRVGAMLVGRVLNIVGQIASALTATHRHKIVHRDLKPQNIFLVRLPGEDREVVKVVDFGISKVREATTQLTQDTAVMGTPQYMSPEQALGKVALIDDRTDEFALGAIAYELLTGSPAFHGENAPTILYQVVHEEPEPMQAMVPNLSSAVAAVVSKALSKVREDRYPTVLEFHRELERAAALGISAEPPSPFQGQAGRPRTEVECPSPTTLGLSAGTIEGLAQRTFISRQRWTVAGVAGFVALAGTLFAMWRPSRHEAFKPATPPTPAVPERAPVAPAKPAVEPKRAVVEIENAPPGLQVMVDGLAGTPPISLPFGPEMHLLEFSAPGFDPTEVRVDGTRERRSLVVAMKPVAAQTRDGVAKNKSPNRPSSHRTTAAKEIGAAPALPPAEAPSAPVEKKAKFITDF